VAALVVGPIDFGGEGDGEVIGICFWGSGDDRAAGRADPPGATQPDPPGARMPRSQVGVEYPARRAGMSRGEMGP